MSYRLKELFDLTGKTVLITGGAGFLGEVHGEAVAELGASVILADLQVGTATEKAKRLATEFGVKTYGIELDVTDESQVVKVLQNLQSERRQVDVLINNAANNPKVTAQLDGHEFSRVENFPLTKWDDDLNVGLKGAFICSKVFGSEMARHGQGVILNISSDLGVHAPDQRIYRLPKTPEEEQPVKPLSYSIAKAGLVALTQYLATYWAHRNVRVNAIAPGGIDNNPPTDFLAKLTNLIPMGRMAKKHELKGVVALLCSEASSYITGQTFLIDGGRSIW